MNLYTLEPNSLALVGTVAVGQGRKYTLVEYCMRRM